MHSNLALDTTILSLSNTALLISVHAAICRTAAFEREQADGCGPCMLLVTPVNVAFAIRSIGLLDLIGGGEEALFRSGTR